MVGQSLSSPINASKQPANRQTHMPGGISVGKQSRMVKTMRQAFDQGYNQVLVKHTDLPSTGVYYYTLTQNGATATRKMVVTK